MSDFINSIREKSEKSDIKALLGSGEIESVFAAACIAAEKALGEKPFDEQLFAAKALCEGKVIEMPTGEGKTLSGVIAAAWHAKNGRSVHILTFNDYLAERDYRWMKPVYDLLEISSAYITAQTDISARRGAYKAQVLYIGARECCFDYLRDFTAQTAEETVFGDFCAAIVDEADSLLIDEARIPMVVASDIKVKRDPQLEECSRFVKTFGEDDYAVSLEADSVYLTDEGAAKIEEHFETENLYDEENAELLSKVNDCLRAQFMLKENQDYINRDGRILLIDKYTGRAAPDRHYPGTLQTAAELKHGLEITTRGVVMGSIALQYFVRQYEFLSGMTGTVGNSAEEFYQLYDLKCEKIPPHVPSIRKDNEIEIYFDSESKWKAVAKAAKEAYDQNRPVLIGTGSIEDSEKIRAELKKLDIDATVLNAKNDREEAGIISDAGKPRTVTVSTNMAGRGVDIKLGGADERLREEAIAAGGLLVISTHMPESGRMVKQIIGRCARQGDPGEGRQFVALDEPIMEKYKLRSLVPPRHYPEKTEERLEDKVLKREIERVQRISEGDGFDNRARLMKFTMIGEKHRNEIFRTRSRFLRGESPKIWETSENYDKAKEILPEEKLKELEIKTAIAAVNRFWSDYLEYTDYLRQGIHLTAVGGKSPAEEYNIAVEEYYLEMEENLREFMLERLDLLIESGIEGYEIEVPGKIRTYLVDDNIDELNKTPFLVSFLSDESERELEELERKKTPSVLDAPVHEDKEEKKGLFGKLFKKKN